MLHQTFAAKPSPVKDAEVTTLAFAGASLLWRLEHGACRPANDNNPDEPPPVASMVLPNRLEAAA